MENTYNAEGRRVAKTVDGSTVRYFYEYGNVAFEYTNSGTVSAFNVIGTNLISREAGSDKVYYFYNGHGDVTALLDATTKNIRSQYRYDEFGNISSETYYDSNGAVTTDDDEIIKSQILYAGYQYDEESKYYNLHARYYDPQTARFLQQDTYTGTIADPLSLNLYAYCHNQPMMYTDPTGYAAEYLKYGSSGEDVKLLQQHLAELGYSLGSYGADGKFGNVTKAAVTQFQKDYEIDVDGIVGNQTWTTLEKAVVLIAAQSKTDIPGSVIEQQINMAKSTTPGPGSFKKTYDAEAYETPSAKTGVGLSSNDSTISQGTGVNGYYPPAQGSIQKLENSIDSQGTGNPGTASSGNQSLITIDGNRAYFAKNSVNGSYGVASGNADIYYGTGKVETKAIVGWEPNWNGTKAKGGKDKEIMGVDLRATAQVSGSSGAANGQLGNNAFGLIGTAEGNVLSAQAYGAATARIDGEASVGLRAGAEAAVATVEAGVGLHIYGYGFVVGVEGSFAAAGAKAEIGVVDGQLKARAKVSAGLGGGIWFNIGKVK